MCLNQTAVDKKSKINTQGQIVKPANGPYNLQNILYLEDRKFEFDKLITAGLKSRLRKQRQRAKGTKRGSRVGNKKRWYVGNLKSGQGGGIYIRRRNYKLVLSE